MITKLMIVQKITLEGKIEVFQVSGEYFQWTFETRRSKKDGDENYYPFIINGNKKILERAPGAETRLSMKPGQLTFCDDYGVPEGTVIAILLPRGFMPDIIKFKDKPYIPVGLNGAVSMRPPGHLQILYNDHEKQSTIIFNINENIVFGFKCVAKEVADNDFPKNESIYVDDLFDASLSREFLNVESIQTDDLKIINQTLEQQYDLTEVKDAMNELLAALKAEDKAKSQNLLGKLSGILTSTVGNASGLATIADSYKSGNSAFQFISKIFEYTQL